MQPTTPIDQQTRPSISLILPAWNESEVIADAISEATLALSRVSEGFEIIVVDDGSTDDTAAIVQRIAVDDDRVRLIRHQPNQGYGAAIRTGFAAAHNELVVFTDADCQFDLMELDRFVLLANRYDVVCGYRIDRQDSAVRCLYSKVYNLLVRALMGTLVRDVDCALKMFHRDVAKRLEIAGDGFLVNTEMLTQAKRLGHSIVEVGVSHRPRTRGESTVSVRHIPHVLTGLIRFWWNQVLFPGNQHPRGERSDRPHPEADRLSTNATRWKLGQFGLLFIAALFLLTNLSYPLIDRDETRYAEIPREMIATGNWILPQLNFQAYYDKPPLVYWLCAISFKLFGISEASARLVPALAGLATLASTMFFGSRICGARAGLISGCVLMLSIGFAFSGRYLLLDGVLSLLVSLSLLTGYEAIRGSRLKLGWWIISGICIGLAFLTKGPLALVLWLPPMIAFTWLSDGHPRLRWWHYAIPLGIASVVAVPWFVAVHQHDSNFLTEFFYKHNLARFGGEFHPKPIWYFIPVLLIAGHPWSFLTIPYVRFLLDPSAESRQQRTPPVGFLLLWSVWCFAFFSISSCKLPTYLLPAAPALALMIGHYLDIVTRQPNDGRHTFARIWSAGGATAANCLAGVGFVIFAMFSIGSMGTSIHVWGFLWVSLLITAGLLFTPRYRSQNGWGWSIGSAVLLVVMVMHTMVPAYSRKQTLFGPSSPLHRQLMVGDRPSIATVDHEFSEVPFYLRRRDIPNFSSNRDAGLDEFISQSGQCFLIVDGRMNANRIRGQLPRNSKMSEVAQRGSATVYQVRIDDRVSRPAATSARSLQDIQR